MACGVPPVTTEGAGASAEIEPGISGFVLATPVDVGELAATLGLLVGNRDLRERVGRAARARAGDLSAQVVFERVEAAMVRVATGEWIPAPN
jgi:glycosyltransferase involved in cell wall biosynthesis